MRKTSARSMSNWSKPRVRRRALRGNTIGFIVATAGIVALVCASSGLAAAGGSAATRATSPKTGTLEGSLVFADKCSTQWGIGIASDGTNLWYTCENRQSARSSTRRLQSFNDLYEANPTTGAVSQRYALNDGLGALAYDTVDKGFWATWGIGQSCGQLYFIKLNANNKVELDSKFIIPNADTGQTCPNTGLAFDSQTRLLYYTDGKLIYVFRTDGTAVTSFSWADASNPDNTCSVEGLSIGSTDVVESTGTCDHVWTQNKATHANDYDFSTSGSGGGLAQEDADLTCDNTTFPGKDVVWSREPRGEVSPGGGTASGRHASTSDNDDAYAFLLPRGACETTTAPVHADVSVTKTAQQIYVCHHNNCVPQPMISYSIGFANSGDGPASNVVIRDKLPKGAIWVKGQGTVNNGELLVSVGDVGASGAGTESFVVELSSALFTKGAIIHNCAMGTYVDGKVTKSTNKSCVDTRVQIPKPPPPVYRPFIIVQNFGPVVSVKPWRTAKANLVGCGKTKWLHTKQSPNLPWTLSAKRHGKEPVHFYRTVWHDRGYYLVTVHKHASMQYTRHPVLLIRTTCRVKPKGGPSIVTTGTRS